MCGARSHLLTKVLLDARLPVLYRLPRDLAHVHAQRLGQVQLHVAALVGVALGELTLLLAQVACGTRHVDEFDALDGLHELGGQLVREVLDLLLKVGEVGLHELHDGDVANVERAAPVAHALRLEELVQPAHLHLIQPVLDGTPVGLHVGAHALEHFVEAGEVAFALHQGRAPRDALLEAAVELRALDAAPDLELLPKGAHLQRPQGTVAASEELALVQWSCAGTV